jgi:hypothetical protein
MVILYPNDPQELPTHRKREVKAKWVFLNFVKDHLIPHIYKNTKAQDMYDDLYLLSHSL